jgi:hypothetical protein
MVQSYVNKGCSAATKVKAVSPEILLIATGQEMLCSETRVNTGVIRRVCSDVPGSQATAGHPKDCIGTWESRIACIALQAEKARTAHGDTAVGLAHSRGVAVVMPGEPCTMRCRHSKGSAVNRIEKLKVEAIH